MQFNSYLFLFLFLPLTLAGYFGLYRLGRGRGARLFLTAASLIFFGYGPCLTGGYPCGLREERSRGFPDGRMPARRSALIWERAGQSPEEGD